MVDPTELVVVKDPAQDIGDEFVTGLLRVHCLLIAVFLTVILLVNRSHTTSFAHLVFRSEKREGLKKMFETKMVLGSPKNGQNTT